MFPLLTAEEQVSSTDKTTRSEQEENVFFWKTDAQSEGLKLWKLCGECRRQTQATCMKESKTKSQTLAVSCWIWHSIELMLWTTLAWSLALVSVLSFVYGVISTDLNQQVKRDRGMKQDIFMPVDNSCSHSLALKIIRKILGQIGILDLLWNFHNRWLEQSVKWVFGADLKKKQNKGCVCCSWFCHL